MEYKIDIYTKKEKREIVETMFNELLDIYVNLQDYYNELNIALKEFDIYSESSLDYFLPVEDKIEYIEKAIKSLRERELEVFREYPYYEEFRSYIKEMNGISLDTDLKDFSFFDTFSKFKFRVLEDNFMAMRMIRASYYYDNYFSHRVNVINEIEEQLDENMFLEYVDEDQVMSTMHPDKTDVFAINTINALSMLYPDADVYYKNKSYLSFINPYLENFYINTTFTEDHLWIDVTLDAQGNRLVQNNIIDSLFVMQKNDIANQKSKKDFVNKTYTLKQLIEILFKFDKHNDKYSSRLNKYINYHIDCLENIELMHSFLYTNYLMLDEQHLCDLDHLLSVMTSDESCITRGQEKLGAKVVNTFFTPLVESNENKIVRVRKEEN